MVIHVSELSNPILVWIREGSCIIHSAISNLKGAKGNCKECISVCWMLPMNQGEPDEYHYPVGEGKHTQPQGRTH
jgi:hypothetical protein